MDASYTSTFNNIDRTTAHVALAPHSPCPVLYGIRGEDPDELPSAMAALKGERPWRWILLETNQGTDDHIRVDDWSLAPYASTSVEVQIVRASRTLPGGHVIVGAKGRRPVDLAFYEPSKDFRKVATQLRPGDRVRVWGSQRDDGKSLNVEKLRVDVVAPERIRIANPVCPRCGKRMKSAGRAQSFRCMRHHARAPPGAGRWEDVARDLRPGWYEPPAFARRHLAKPVKRIRTAAITNSAARPDAPRGIEPSKAR
jgi:tRNA(Ile2)-agmatinylcytidine synthase